MHYYYILALFISLGGLFFADRRLKLVIFRDARLAAACIITAIGFFVTWDVTGILLKVFSTNQDWVSGVHIISQDLPIEEFFFLTLFSYATLLTWRLVCTRIS